MKLTRSHGSDIENPTDRQIDEALEDIEDDNGSFVILARGDEFIQTTGQLPDQLLVEYREDDTQYRSVNPSLSLDAVKEIFKQYRWGDATWKREHQWKEVDIAGGGAGCAGTIACWVLTAVVAAVAAV